MPLLLALLCSLLLAACGGTTAPSDGDGAARPRGDGARAGGGAKAPRDGAAKALGDGAPGATDDAPAAGAKGKAPVTKRSALLNARRAREQAPETFRVLFRTTEGEIEIECVRAWSPQGVDRFYNLVTTGFYARSPFFAVSKGRYAMCGLPLNPKVGMAWRSTPIEDEPALESNRRGTLAFGRPRSQPNSRSTELILNLGDNPDFDSVTAPIGRVVRGLEVADALYDGYATDLDPKTLASQGEAYLSGFPEIDRIQEAVLVE